MVKDAEQHAEEDAARKEEAEVRNNADALVNATQQTLDELGDKVPADAKTQAEEAIAETKTALEGTDIDAIKAATEKIQQAGYKLAMAMRRHNPDPKDEESVLDEEDRKGERNEASGGGEAPSVEAAGGGGETPDGPTLE